MDPETEAWEFIHNPGYAHGQGHAVHWTTVRPPGHYVGLVELPGFDPAKDIKVSLDGDMLTVHAERRTEQKEADWSQCLDISFSRSVRLPARPNVNSARARYDKGILQISVSEDQYASEDEPSESRQIEIQHDNG